MLEFSSCLGNIHYFYLKIYIKLEYNSLIILFIFSKSIIYPSLFYQDLISFDIAFKKFNF